MAVFLPDSDYVRVSPEGYGNLSVVSETHLVGSFPAGPRMARGVALLVGALLVKFVGLVLVYGVPIPTGVMLPSIMVSFNLVVLTYCVVFLGLPPQSPSSLAS